MKSIFKKESLIMTLVLICYGFIAGGSVDLIFENSFWIIGGLLLIFIILGITATRYDKENKKRRKELVKDFELQKNDFDLTDKVGDDSVSLYFDVNKEKVLIASFLSGTTNEHYINDFKKTGCKQLPCSCCAIDNHKRKALLAQWYNNDLKYEIFEYGVNDKNKEGTVNNSIPPTIYAAFLPKSKKTQVSDITLPTYFILEEQYGYITMIYNSSIRSFNYIDCQSISQKTGSTSSTTFRKIGAYIFIMDDYFKVLVIISTRLMENKILNYSDIINVTYEEDGNTLFSKSMVRTVGGALVGRALMGGAGAIIGGLSGDTSQNKKVQSMNIKILVRSTTSPSINLPINLIGETFNTKDEKSKNTYKSRIKEANAIKDLISVIIDNSNLQTTQTSVSPSTEASKPVDNIADELIKLSQLKDAGILSEEEFQQQKKKILN